MNEINRYTAGHFALVNGRLVLPDSVLSGQALVIDGERIAGIAAPGELGDEIRRIDVGGRLITPGLVDIHIHGALGHTFNEPTDEAFATITAENARRGVTGLLATTATAPIQALVASLERARSWMQNPQPGAQILGVHVEGPYFAPAQAGAQDPAHLRTPDDGSPEALLAHHDVIRIMSYAPELPGAVALTRRLVALEIVPAAGHSAAREEDLLPALEAGLRHTIHIWSAQSTTVREGPWRKPGLLEVTLTYDNLTAEMISDNRHLPPTLMKLAYKCIGPDRLCAISDATSGAGLPEGARFRMGGMEYEVHDGVGMLLDRTAFAGSTTLLNQMLPILTDVVGIPLAAAVRMASLTPARVIGLADRKGSLAPGKDADVAIFNPDFSAWGTLVRGRWVHGPGEAMQAGDGSGDPSMMQISQKK
ncbi:N-acetylglucosamine-6-phosphate deacetylase [Litorilinea aerophila]|uniref:N-acetylglucosamine-6-phosphate deacetylase n=1 Tax=Litorilinea aerophila TaxID=1204385 RepID=A0A540VDG2_9CHLR|nr:N-acetylglucosamine-6-phosphate deacetylase [Litorilinea aerophila]MCC9077502.1 N-acetylglucosamine-6-phosphate deacetylase [Litorilinea aerophila]